MANKKFRRFITGILLSCNIASFSFCSANYDVLTEAIANQSGSEQLKTLYRVGRMVQENYAKNQAKIAQANETATTLYNQSIKELDDLQQYYDELFADCCDHQKLKKLKDAIIESVIKDIIQYEKTEGQLSDDFIRYYADKKICTCYEYRFVPLLFLMGDMESFVSYKKFLEPKIDTLTDLIMLKTTLPKQIALMSLMTKDDIHAEGNEAMPTKLSESQTMYQDIKTDAQNLWRDIKGKVLPSLIDKYNYQMYPKAVELYQKSHTLKDMTLPSNTKLRQAQISVLLKETLFKDFQTTVTITNSIPRTKISKKKITKKTPQKKTQTRTIKHDWEQHYADKLSEYRDKILNLIQREINLLTTDSPSVVSYLEKAERCNLINPETLTNKIHPLLDTITKNLRIGIRQKSQTCTSVFFVPPAEYTEVPYLVNADDSLIQMLVSQANIHLKDHFESDKLLSKHPERKLTGEFVKTRSIFKNTCTVQELMEMSRKTNLECISNMYAVKESDGRIMYNYVCYIYDYDKYGFAKTGEVYDADAKTWYPAYAVMFVTDDKNAMITAYPLYM